LDYACTKAKADIPKSKGDIWILKKELFGRKR
jgi:hypothetical protein